MTGFDARLGDHCALARRCSNFTSRTTLGLTSVCLAVGGQAQVEKICRLLGREFADKADWYPTIRSSSWPIASVYPNFDLSVASQTPTHWPPCLAAHLPS